MPSAGTMSPSLSMLVALGSICGVTGTTLTWPVCDNGKLSVEKDLPQDAVRVCPLSPWPEPVQLRPVDNKYDPEPARMECMDKPIRYNHRLPSSGAYRPVRAESGEYLYCPPQRWLNNLRHGSTVLLYHPCAPLHERVHLFVLAYSCLTNYIISPHPGLHKHRPIALVSWGRTLELSSVTASAVCDWLESTTTASTRSDVIPTGEYNYLLTRSAERLARSPEHQYALTEKLLSTGAKQSVKHCCQHSLADTEVHTRRRRRRRRSTRRDQRPDEDKQLRPKLHVPSPSTSETAGTALCRTVPGEVQRRAHTSGDSLRDSLSSDLPAHRKAAPEPASPGTAVGHNASGSTPAQRSTDVDRKGKDLSQQMDTRVVKQKAFTGNNVARDTVEGHELIDVKRRELENSKPAAHAPSRSDENGAESNPATQQASHPSGPPEWGACNPESTNVSRLQERAVVISKALLRTPRTNEAVWAALALGSLLVLLALSVLHTRLYRHWRTSPSLYWHEPRQDYDTVADVIRRRLRMIRRKRGASQSRRQVRVLLPNSSGSDESHYEP